MGERAKCFMFTGVKLVHLIGSLERRFVDGGEDEGVPGVNSRFSLKAAIF